MMKAELILRWYYYQHIVGYKGQRRSVIVVLLFILLVLSHPPWVSER
jgi:hypothetical protein